MPETPDGKETDWLKRLSNLPPPREYSPEVNLFEEDSKVEDPYIIEKGVVKLWIQRFDSREFVVNLRFPGQLLGAASVIIARPSPVTATTVTRCLIRRIPSESFLASLGHDCVVGWDLHRMLSSDVVEYIDRVIELGCLSARDRLLRLFYILIKHMRTKFPAKELPLPMPLKAEEMASLIGVTREHYCRILTQLEADGLIRRCKGRVIVRNVQKLLA